MTHIYILTSIDSDGETWVVNVCDTLDTAQRARDLFALQLVNDGICSNVDAAIDGRQMRISASRIQSRAAIDAEYSAK